MRILGEFCHEDYARAGAKALHDFALPEGPLEGPAGPLQHTMEPQLRKYGMPTKLNKGVVELNQDFRVGSTWASGRVLTRIECGFLPGL